MFFGYSIQQAPGRAPSQPMPVEVASSGDGECASRTNFCLRWSGGNMPPHGDRYDAAVRDLLAWVAAGAAWDRVFARTCKFFV